MTNEGLKPVDPDLISEYERLMIKEVVPQILCDIERRSKLANVARRKGPLFRRHAGE